MEEDGTEWLPVVEFDGVEYVVDVQNRCFGQLLDPAAVVAFHSHEGRQMVKAMAGMEWWAWTPRGRMDDRKGVM